MSESASWDHDAFGLSRGTRGVNQICEIGGRVVHGQICGGTLGECGFFLVQKNDATRRFWKDLFHGGMGKKERRFGVREHEGKAILGKLRIKGKISAAGLKDRKKSDDGIEGAIEADTDETLRTGTLAAEKMGEAVGSGIQFPVRKLMGAKEQCWRVGSSLSLVFKKLVRALRDRVQSMGIIVVCGHSRIL